MVDFAGPPVHCRRPGSLTRPSILGSSPRTAITGEEGDGSKNSPSLHFDDSNINTSATPTNRKNSKTATYKKRSLQPKVTCGDCSETFTDPKTLPCAHTFCLECIKKYINPRNLVQCPICKVEHSVLSKDDLANYPCDPAILIGLKEWTKKNSISVPSHHCQPSDFAEDQIVGSPNACNVGTGGNGQFSPFFHQVHASTIRDQVKMVTEYLNNSDSKLDEIMKEHEFKLSVVQEEADTVLEKQIQQLQSKRQLLTDEIEETKRKHLEQVTRMRAQAASMLKRDVPVEDSKDVDMINALTSLHGNFTNFKLSLDNLQHTVFSLDKIEPLKLVITRGMSNVDHNDLRPQFSMVSPSQPRFSTYSRIKVPANKKPSCAAICPWNNNVYVCVPDKKCVEVFDLRGNHVRAISGTTFLHPVKVAFFERPELVYVLDKWASSINVWDEKSGMFTTCLGGPGQSLGRLQTPSGFCTDSEGNVYVADTGNDRVQMLSSRGKFIRLFGGSYKKHSTGSFIESELSQPEDVCISPDGNTVAVADTGNNRVRLYTCNGGKITIIGMRGKGKTQLDTPLAVDISTANLLLIGDSKNNRIQIFTLAGHYVNTVHKYRKVRCITSNKTGDLILIVEASSSVVSIVQ